MQRRDFLLGTAASAVGIVGWSRTGRAQAQPPAQPQSQGRGQGRGQSPANVSPEKLRRISIMTLNFGSILKLPWNKSPTAEQTLALLDLPQMYVDTYGVHNVEFQHSHLAPSDAALGNIDGDPELFKELKARLDAAKSTMTQINLEFGPQNISNPDAALRQQAVERVKKWIDHAVMMGCPRVMINQSQNTLNQETKAHAIATWKAMSDYGKTKKVMVSAETRGGAAANAAPGTPPPWHLLKEVIEAAGAHSNVDIGNVGAMNQQELHDCIKGLLSTSSGNMHIKANSPYWDVGAAIKYTNSTLGYKGLYSIEVSTHPAVRIAYNIILANI